VRGHGSEVGAHAAETKTGEKARRDERNGKETSDLDVRARLAYHDEQFLDSDEARPLRTLAEYLEPLSCFQREHIHGTIVFFGSARLREDGPLGRYYAEARELARLCTEWSRSLAPGTQRFVVCSGGGGGIVEAANRGASDAGG